LKKFQKLERGNSAKLIRANERRHGAFKSGTRGFKVFLFNWCFNHNIGQSWVAHVKAADSGGDKISERPPAIVVITSNNETTIMEPLDRHCSMTDRFRSDYPPALTFETPSSFLNFSRGNSRLRPPAEPYVTVPVSDQMRFCHNDLFSRHARPAEGKPIRKPFRFF
jgi:hypothetical protein